MTHRIFAGVTQSGKTTLARHFCRSFAAMGHKTIVYDPVGTKTAGGEWATNSVVFNGDDPTEFFDYLKRDDVYHAHVFCDEAGDYFGVSDRLNHWLLRRGRHKGFFVNVISQRPKMLAPNVRTQCGQAFIFRLAVDDADEIGRDFGHTNLGKHVSALDKGEYLMLISGTPAIAKGNVFKQLSSNTPKG